MKTLEEKITDLEKAVFELRISINTNKKTEAAEVEREACAKLLDNQRYISLDPLRTYTAEEARQLIRSAVDRLAALIRRRN